MISSWSSCSREGLSGWEPKLSGLVSWKASLAQSSDHRSGLTGSARPFAPCPWRARGRCMGSWFFQEELEPPWCDQQNFRKHEEGERRCVATRGLAPGLQLPPCPLKGLPGRVF